MKKFVGRWFKEIIIALGLAIIAAIIVDPFNAWRSEKTAQEILQNNLKAIAVIQSYDSNGKKLGQGSGFFVNSTGEMVTNYHVIKGADITRTTAKVPTTGASYTMKNLAGGDEKKDIAILQLDARETSYVDLGDSNDIVSGQKVIAIGAPLGLENTVSDGIISNPNREIEGQKYIQFTAPISPGNSGGGLFNTRGNVIGITAAFIPGTQEEPGHNLNLAVPINLVRDNLSGKDTSLTTDSAPYWYSLGQLAVNRHQNDEALADFNKAIAIDDAYADAYIGMGGIYYEKGNYDLEFKNYEKAVQLDPTNYEAVYWLGSAYEDIGQYSDAIKEYKEALKLKPDDKDSMYYLALLSILNGDKNTARAILPSLKEQDAGLGKEIEALLKITIGK